MLKKDTPCPKTKKKPQWDGRRDEITIKSNSIPAGWVTHKLENSKTKEVLPLLWRFWTPHQASPYGDLTKELGIHKEYGHEGQRHPHCGRILYQLSHEESLRILEWVAYPFSSRSSWPRNQTGDSCIAGGFFTNWVMRETKGNRDSSLGGHKQNPVHTRMQRKGAVTHGRLNQNYLPVLEALLWRCGRQGLTRDRATGSSPGRSPLHKRSWRSPPSLSQSP